MNENPNIGVLFLGDSSVGKTTIINTQRQETLDPVPTISTDSFLINYNGVNLVLYDTAGQERFRSPSTIFYKSSSIAVIVFDVSNKQSFKNLNYWLNSLDDYADQIKLILVGNKIDLDPNFELQEVQELADKLECQYILTCATNGQGIGDLFSLITAIATNLNNSTKTEDTVDLNSKNEKSTCC